MNRQRDRVTNRPGGLTLTRQALESCGFEPGDLILDAGCGFGTTVRFMGETAGFRGVGLDGDFSRLVPARENIGNAGALVAARLPRLPFRPGNFKGIICECVLSLVPEKRACLEGFYSALAPGGRMILADLVLPEGAGREQGETRSGLPATCLDGALTAAGLEAEIGAAGFRILETGDHTRLLKEMACEMVFEHGSLDRFWQSLTGTDISSGMAGLCRAGKFKPGYMMVRAVKPE